MNRAPVIPVVSFVIPAQAGIHPAHPCILKILMQTGEIPVELGSLTSLTILNLSNNRLAGAIPDLSILTSLRELFLQDNQLTGEIPTWLGSLTNLRSLRLSNNRLTGSVPEELGQWWSYSGCISPATPSSRAPFPARSSLWPV